MFISAGPSCQASIFSQQCVCFIDLRRLFICSLQLSFEEDLRISSMFSGEGECVPFSNSLYPTGNVEDWLLEVENTMRGSLREILNRALLVYPEVTCYTVCYFNVALNCSQFYNIRSPES